MKRIVIYLFLFFCFIFNFKSVFAADLIFFEFSSRPRNSLKIASFSPLYQPFKIVNDFLSGFDFWIDNGGASGSASFSLYDKNNNLIVSKTVSIPYIASTFLGQRFHIDLGQQFAVKSGEIYKIKISSSMPELRFFNSDIIRLLPYDLSFPVEELVMPAVAGLQERNFAFNFALYEAEETSLPTIYNVLVQPLSPYETKFIFSANEAVDYKIIYWPTSGGDILSADYNGVYRFCGEGVSACSLTVSTFADTSYNYQLFVKDIWSNESSVGGIFVSPADLSSLPAPTPTPTPTLAPTSTSLPGSGASDTISPEILNVRIVSLTKNSAQIVWQTNEAANSNLKTSLDSGGSQIINNLSDSVFELEHLINLDFLSPSTKYFVFIASSDAFGNAAFYNTSFATLKADLQPSSQITAQKTPENFGQLSGNIQASLSEEKNGKADLLVQWQSGGDNNDGYRIDVFDSADKKIEKQIFAGKGAYEAEISDILAKDYYVVVYENKDGVLEKIAPPEDIIVPKEEKIIAQVAPGKTKKLLLKISIGLPLFILLIIGVCFIRKKYGLKRKIFKESEDGDYTYLP